MKFRKPKWIAGSNRAAKTGEGLVRRAPPAECCCLAAKHAVPIDELPDDAILDPEPLSGLGDAEPAIAGGEAVVGDGVEQLLTLRAVWCFRR